MYDEVKRYMDYAITKFPTGSRVICNPPVLDTDEDWVLLMPRDWPLKLGTTKLIKCSEETGDTYDGEATKFCAYRYEEFNLIMTSSIEFFDCMYKATEFATKYNIRDKQDRIRLFKAFRGESIV